MKVLATYHKLLLLFYRPLVRNKVKAIEAFNVIRVGHVVAIIDKVEIFCQRLLNCIYAVFIMN